MYFTKKMKKTIQDLTDLFCTKNSDHLEGFFDLRLIGVFTTLQIRHITGRAWDNYIDHILQKNNAD